MTTTYEVREMSGSRVLARRTIRAETRRGAVAAATFLPESDLTFMDAGYEADAEDNYAARFSTPANRQFIIMEPAPRRAAPATRGPWVSMKVCG